MSFREEQTGKTSDKPKIRRNSVRWHRDRVEGRPSLNANHIPLAASNVNPAIQAKISLSVRGLLSSRNFVLFHDVHGASPRRRKKRSFDNTRSASCLLERFLRGSFINTSCHYRSAAAYRFVLQITGQGAPVSIVSPTCPRSCLLAVCHFAWNY